MLGALIGTAVAHPADDQRTNAAMTRWSFGLKKRMKIFL
jgi:hypothetical protein